MVGYFSLSFHRKSSVFAVTVRRMRGAAYGEMALDFEGTNWCAATKLREAAFEMIPTY